MAKISGNPAVKGASGMINKTLVYRKYKDGMILTGAPEKSTKAPSVKQLEHRKQFKMANFYASRVKADKKLVAAYQQACELHEYHNLHSFIVADYFNSPEVLGRITSYNVCYTKLLRKLCKLWYSCNSQACW